MPPKKLSRARVVEVLGSVGPPRLSPKRSAAAGGGLLDMYPQLTQTAANSLANHIHSASRVDPTRELDYFLGEVETIFPELKRPPPAPPSVAPKLCKRADYPPFARPYGDLPPKGHIPTSRAGGSGGFNDVDTGAKPAGNGKLIDLPSASQPTTPGPRARGGGRDGGYGGQGEAGRQEPQPSRRAWVGWEALIKVTDGRIQN